MYIASAAQISSQKPLCEDWLTDPIRHPAGGYVRASDPDFGQWIAPMTARRMSPIVKRAITTSLVALHAAGVDMPDAVVAGTGLGCVENTEKFLDAMVRSGEQLLQPTHFIQSTHNTIASQIALTLGCNGYNNTYVHRGVSFESALFDVWLQFRLGQIETALVGGHDELTPSYHKMLSKIGFYTQGAYGSEGSTSFVLTKEKREGCLAKVAQVELLHRPSNWNELCRAVQPDAVVDNFTELCGEYFTASAFGLYVAAHRLVCEKLDRVLFVNNYQGEDYALIVLERC